MRRGRPPYPGILTPREEEVLALLREGLSNPVIAERLGISRAGAAFHVSEILSKLQVHSREEAAAWTPAAEHSRRRVPLPAFLATALQRLVSASFMKFAASGAIAVAALAFGLLAFGVFEMRNRQPEAEPPPPAQAAASPTPEPEVLDSPLSGPISDGLVSRALAPDETPDETHGIALVHTATGEGEVWSLPTDDWVTYDASPDHRWLVAYTWDPTAGSVVVERQTGLQYRLDGARWGIAAGPTSDGLLLLRAVDGPGELRVVDLATDPTGSGVEVDVPSAPEPGGRAAVFLGGGSHALIDGQIVDLTTGGAVRTIWSAPGALTVSLTRLVDGGAVAVVLTGDRGAPDVSTFRVDAGGNLTGQQVFLAQAFAGAGFGQSQSPDGVRVSPDGRWLAWQSALSLGSVAFSEYWPVVVVADLQRGEVVLRVVRASIREGEMDFQSAARAAWLSDSSGLVLKTPGGSALLRVEGEGSLEPLPFAGAAPVPATSDPGIFVHDGQLVSLDGAPLGPRSGLGDWPLGDPLDRVALSETGDEIRFVKVIPPGRDWTIHILDGVELPAVVQRAPFTDDLRVAVAADGDGLNLRSAPSEGAEIVATLSDGAGASVTRSPEEHRGVETSAVPDQAAIDAGELWWRAPWWLHVRTDGGQEGWVRAEFLDWAE